MFVTVFGSYRDRKDEHRVVQTGGALRFPFNQWYISPPTNLLIFNQKSVPTILMLSTNLNARERKRIMVERPANTDWWWGSMSQNGSKNSPQWSTAQAMEGVTMTRRGSERQTGTIDRYTYQVHRLTNTSWLTVIECTSKRHSQFYREFLIDGC